MEGLQDLTAVVLAEARASCGCAFVFCASRMIEGRTARLLVGREVVVVPCGEPEHVIYARVAYERVGDDVTLCEVCGRECDADERQFPGSEPGEDALPHLCKPRLGELVEEFERITGLA